MMRVKDLVKLFDPRPPPDNPLDDPLKSPPGAAPNYPQSFRLWGPTQRFKNPHYTRTRHPRAREIGHDVPNFARGLYTPPVPLRSPISGLRKSPSNDDERMLLVGKMNPSGSHRSDTPYEATLAPSPIPSKPQHAPNHIPVPATVVFARRAAPLYLPKLDKYLSSISPPDFRYSRPPQSIMFSPMDQLEKTAKSLDDLEANSTKPPAWRNRNSILGGIVNIVIGVTGSSALASFYSLQGVFNTIQVFALILSTIVPAGGRHVQERWRKLFLGTIPNVLALNFASTLVQSLLFLLVFMAITAGLLYSFYRSSQQCHKFDSVEGLQQTGFKGKQWSLVIVTFLLTTIYLPLSTMAIHVLVWSEDLWVVPNPYKNATSFPPTVAPLGPVDEYRDPLDFCWTTTMKKDQINYAPIFIIISAAVFFCLAICYPIALRRAIRQEVPIVDKFTEMGRARNSLEMDEEYHRMLMRDRNPFMFLYGGFRRDWGTYESVYLSAKLSTLLIIAIIDPDNCLFRGLSRSRIAIVRQVLLLVSTIGFFGAQCIYAPFLDPVNNASEWVSRLNYVTTSAVALAVALDIPNKDVVETYFLYTIYVVTYGFTFYFLLIGLGVMQRAVKRLTKRIDFSIDIFSPRLDVSSSSPHARRRIWQESISTLVLTSPLCAIPQEQLMIYAQARDSEFPPYLLNFAGSPGERHVENIKILREVGTFAYSKAVALLSGPEQKRFWRIANDIQTNFVGPDSYWKGPFAEPGLPFTNYFGNAWWIPFPPTLVMKYDDGPLVTIKELKELEEYISENSNPEIQRKRQVRLLFRALENQVVVWPYIHHVSIGEPAGGWFGQKHYRATGTIHYKSCVLKIRRKGRLMWNRLQLGSGFTVELDYGKGVTLTGDEIGLNDEFELTPSVAKFFSLNEGLISSGLKEVEDDLWSYRKYYQKLAREKNRVLTYGFLSTVYNRPHDIYAPIVGEGDPRVRELVIDNTRTLRGAYERLKIVSRSEATTWWYLFWDDLWRRNHDTVAGLQRHAQDFNPHYPTSIAYTPLPRAALEAFLVQRGLLSKSGRSSMIFTSGFLNKLYVRLNDTVFRSSGQAILFHLGDGDTERDMIEVDLETRMGPHSTIGTGGGTDHNNSWIQPRPEYRWEGMLGDPLGKGKQGRRHLLAKLGAWLGVTPTWRAGIPTSGLALDVRLENGRYVVIESK